MQRRLPPLSALKAFEATSRLLSAKKAAEELFVTPAAISHQIKALETFLGLKLFKRMNRQLLLTHDGLQYAATLQKIFDQLFAETQKIMKKKHAHLTVSVETEFAMYWLVPRLNKFNTAYPNIELNVLASYELTDFKKSDIDLGIRYGFGNYPGLQSILLFHNEFYAVCYPRLLKEHPIETSEDLKHHILLHRKLRLQSSDYPVWETWFAAMGAPEVELGNGIILETGFVIMQAVLSGQGVAIQPKRYVEAALHEGKLKRVFNDFSMVESNTGIYIVGLAEHIKDPAIQTFIHWLQSEAENSEPF